MFYLSVCLSVCLSVYLSLLRTFFVKYWPSLGEHLFDHHLGNGWKVWSNGTTSVPKSVPLLLLVMLRVLVFHCISTICQSSKYLLELYIQIQINQLLIFIEKSSPLTGFEPRTSRVTRWCATNWAIQAWILLRTLSNQSKTKICFVDVQRFGIDF